MRRHFNGCIQPAVLVSTFLFSTFTFASPSAQLCMEAVNTASEYATANRKLAESRFNSNQISSSAFEQLIMEVRDIEASLTMDRCMASQGKELEVYQCLASNAGNYAACR